MQNQIETSLIPNEIYKVYIILNSDLNLSIGKYLSQVSHATSKLERFLYKNFGKDFYVKDKWISSGERVIILKANLNTIEKIKKDYPKNYIPIVENGFTEVLTGTETGIILTPILETNKSKTLKRCRAFE